MKKLLFLFLLTATVAHAEMYKWTDSKGTVHFSESMGDVPADHRQDMQAIEMDAYKPAAHSPTPTVSPAGPEQRTNDAGSVAPDAGDLKTRMMKDEKIMDLIHVLQNDREMQTLLSNPAIIRAIQSGDVGTLMNNPDFLKIFDNPKVQEIEERLSHGQGK